MRTTIHIPAPCAQSWDAMTPTAAGRHCAACQTEVVDFTRMTEAEVLAYLAARKGQRVCALLLAPLVPQHYKRPKGPRRWLLTIAAFLGWSAALGLPPQPLPQKVALVKSDPDKERIIICGTVLDDSLNIPLAGIYVFISGTKYGAITDKEGQFSLSLPADWKILKDGEVILDIKGVAFVLQGQIVVVKAAEQDAPLTVRLLSEAGRNANFGAPGFKVGKIKLLAPPVPPPGSRKNRH